MDGRTKKMALLLGDSELAEALSAVGIDDPKKLREATDTDLKAARGVGAATVKRIRKRFPKVRG